MELSGTVLNVVDFGAFVDIGLHDTGLVHISQLANKYVRDPHEVVSVGDTVKVWVHEIDKTRRRVSLTMIAPGTPRGNERRGRPKRGDKPAPQASRSPARCQRGAAGSAAPATAPRPQAAKLRRRGRQRGRGATGQPADRPAAISPPAARRRRARWTARSPAASEVQERAAQKAEAAGADHPRHERRARAAADVWRSETVYRIQNARQPSADSRPKAAQPHAREPAPRGCDRPKPRTRRSTAHRPAAGRAEAGDGRQ